MITILFKTDRFNLSRVGDDFINDCCFGEDLSRWLVDELPKVGVAADVICMEDFGWANQASCDRRSYLMCVSGNSDQSEGRPDYGCWHLMFDKRRTLVDRVLGRNQESMDEPIFAKVIGVLRSAGFEDVDFE